MFFTRVAWNPIEDGGGCALVSGRPKEPGDTCRGEGISIVGRFGPRSSMARSRVASSERLSSRRSVLEVVLTLKFAHASGHLVCQVG